MSDTTKIHSQYNQAITALNTESGNMPQIIEALKAREDWWRANSDESLNQHDQMCDDLTGIAGALNLHDCTAAQMIAAIDAALAEAERLRAALEDSDNKAETFNNTQKKQRNENRRARRGLHNEMQYWNRMHMLEVFLPGTRKETIDENRKLVIDGRIEAISRALDPLYGKRGEKDGA